ncbi:(2Fe-2S)-binding protein [Natronomonas salina]|uniref:(2Fe-2S)-binding protein n=1 Tax=Natronomonas salina TaxID=1710540 RepID=UPI0015B6868E|nr:(2Fe-2S)-binding protein [Natronomonas salina]QLD89138.1 (2Fe-2S)-binding protein [Natronomonas salina]
MSEINEITIDLNGEEQTFSVKPGVPLRDAIRNELQMTGTKEACEVGECGSCMTLIEGTPVKSCLVPAHQANGKEVTTVEGLADDDLHPVQEGFIEEFGLQCGYCTPGFIISSVALLEENPNPSREEIKQYLKGNLCRCTGYTKIFDAVEHAAEAYDE